MPDGRVALNRYLMSDNIVLTLAVARSVTITHDIYDIHSLGNINGQSYTCMKI